MINTSSLVAMYLLFSLPLRKSRKTKRRCISSDESEAEMERINSTRYIKEKFTTFDAIGIFSRLLQKNPQNHP